MTSTQVKQGWRKVKLFEIADIIMGQSPKSEYYTNNTDDLPFYQGCTEFQDLYPIEKQYCSSPTKISEKNDVLMSVRAPVGLLNISTKKCCIGRGLCAIRPKDNRYWFLYYLLKANVEYIQSFQKGSVYGAVNKNDVINLEFFIPESNEEKDKITSILSAFDDLIENNTKRIKILENTAQLIYKEWFVDFKFPGHEKVKMVDCGTEFGEIPEGWEVGSIGDLYEIKSGFAFKSKDFGDIGNPIIKIKNLSSDNTIDLINVDRVEDDAIQKAEKFKLQEKDILIAMTGATIGKFGIMPKTKETFYVNQRVGKFFRKRAFLKNCFIYFVLPSDFVQKEIVNIALGAAQPNISGSGIESIKLLIPTNQKIAEFELIAEPMIDEILLLQNRNQKLRETRDLLLPKLVEGEVDVDNLNL